MKKLAVILNGPIINDGRVQRTINVMMDYFDVDLFYLNGTEADEKLFPKGKVKFYSFEYKHDENNRIKKNFVIHNMFDSFEQRIEQFSKYDFVFCNDYPTLYYGYQAKLINPKLKLIYDSHEIFTETFNQFYPNKGFRGLVWSAIVYGLREYHKRREMIFVSAVDKMITVNTSLQNYFSETYGVESAAVYNVPYLKSVEKDVSIRQIPALSKNDKIILYQGIFNDGRGLKQLIETFSFLPPNYHLVLIGYGTLEGQLKKLASDLKLENVHFMGKVDYEDLHSYTRTADLGIFLLEPVNLSKKFASANKIFEYMKAGIPILTTDQPENRRVINESKCGILLDGIEPETVAENIKELLEDQERSKIMGQRGYAKFLEMYNWEIEKKKLAALFENVFSG